MIQPLSDLQKLPIHERLQLVEDLWDSIVMEDSDLDMPQWQKDEIERRAEKFDASPTSGIPWETAKETIRGRHV